LVLDIDGTLLNKNGQISMTDKSAISKARQNGTIVSLCTGRTTLAAYKVLRELNLDGAHIFFDGTLVYDPQKDLEVYSRPIPPELVEEMAEYALREKMPLDLFSRTHYYVTELSWRTDLRRDFFGIQATVCDFHNIWKRQIIIKGGMALKTPEETELAKKFAHDFANRLNLTWSVTPSFPDLRFINVVCQGTSKGLALEALCQHLEIGLGQVCAIGDGENDISLISTAGLGIAMQNSTDELKSRSSYITGNVEQSGVAQAIRKFILRTAS
jgi:Cof subfamily protein (haloacid dehalogenase superfamily)